MVDKVRTPPIPYVLGGRSAKGTDCVNLIGWAFDSLGGRKIQRTSTEFCMIDMQTLGSLKAVKDNGGLFPGMALAIYEGPTARWPKGSYSHVGVYVGPIKGLLTPDGKQADVVHASASRGCVCGSTLANGWTHAGLIKDTDYRDDITAPSNTVNSEDVSPDISIEPGPGEVKVFTSNGKGVRLRRNPRIVENPTNVICTIPEGSILRIIDKVQGWVKIPYGIHEGWAMTDYLKFSEEEHGA